MFIRDTTETVRRQERVADRETFDRALALRPSKAGAARDHFLGVTAISGRGETFKSGGRVVKNGTGHDLCKLLAGSWGTLAVMTEVTLKVMPMPESERTLVLEMLASGRVTVD